MDTSHTAPVAAPVDCEALAGALSALGLLYGARDALAGAASNAVDEAEVVRTFIRSERSHLLASYSLDDLVSLVLAARSCNARAPASMETYCPA